MCCRYLSILTNETTFSLGTDLGQKTHKDYLAPTPQLDVILLALEQLERSVKGIRNMIKTWQEEGYGDQTTEGSNQADKDRPFV
jgi:hypothetical protein